jgi:transposase
VRLTPPSCAKPFVGRGRTGAAGAEAICTAVMQPAMRFVTVKTETQQPVLMQPRTRDFLVRQLTQPANAIRAHLGAFSMAVARGVHNLGPLVAGAEAADLPPEGCLPPDLLAGRFHDTKTRTDATARRLRIRPGIGPITASKPVATLPDVTTFRPARDLAASLGLTPRAHSSGGRERVGSISRIGNRYLRRLLCLGATGVIAARRKADPGRDTGHDGLGRLIATKPPKVAAIAPANRMAPAVWAMLRTGDVFWRAA